MLDQIPQQSFMSLITVGIGMKVGEKVKESQLENI